MIPKHWKIVMCLIAIFLIAILMLSVFQILYLYVFAGLGENWVDRALVYIYPASISGIILFGWFCAFLENHVQE